MIYSSFLCFGFGSISGSRKVDCSPKIKARCYKLGDSQMIRNDGKSHHLMLRSGRFRQTHDGDAEDSGGVRWIFLVCRSSHQFISIA